MTSKIAMIACSLLLAQSMWAGQRREFRLDLTPYGFPAGKASNPDSCAAPFMYYRAIRWLDSEQILVTFNTSPVCPPAEHAYPLPSTTRLVTFDLSGKMLHAADISYLADLDEPGYRKNDLVWIGPDSSVLVYIPGIEKGSLRVFTKELQPVQSFETDSYAPGIEFEGIAPDQRGVIFSRGEKPWTQRTCVSYKRLPLDHPDECTSELLSETQDQFQDLGRFQVPDGQRAILLNNSDDSTRSAIFAIKDGNGLCQLAGVFCPLHGYLLIYDQVTGITISHTPFPEYGRAALSPDGRYVATFIGNKVEVIRLP